MEDVFEKTCKYYLEQVRDIDIKSIGPKLGLESGAKDVIIPLLGRRYIVSEGGISGASGKRPSFEECVILCKYLLLCPEHCTEDKHWVSYRDLKDSGPLTTYFKNDVEMAISRYYGGRVADLRESGILIGGYSPELNIACDTLLQFDLLPKVSILMVFNDEDDEFPASCLILFQKRAEEFLDAECLAMGGRLLFTSLKDRDRKERRHTCEGNSGAALK